MCEDWSDAGDDLGPEDMEMLYDAPEYVYEEYESDDYCPDDYPDWGEEDSTTEESVTSSSPARLSLNAKSRRASIIHWLSRSEASVPFEGGNGFSVMAGYMVRLIDGSIHDLLDWLQQEGIRDGVHSAGYGVRLDHCGDAGIPRLSFYRVLDAPFHHLQRAVCMTASDDEADEDIPF